MTIDTFAVYIEREYNFNIFLKNTSKSVLLYTKIHIPKLQNKVCKMKRSIIISDSKYVLF